ncbi:hypothetical protein Asp14428_58760 [Actinoplanes sp. NBRC 14428]|uniref:Lipoprotein LprG n=1 Tax=Pseudosporangium ferrugineum TaxID=439699 RepID=A0A2T0SDF5_9ACTN|nr:hypothetical protein [Pseudosporangium ferrugineum]PRY31455.1 hypothetical protein CLV70_103342 [Pseudosporangium ferrugineum]BCJ54401.1 hypothetical protein Asp14428_58760 [Actinoplanes sp. NBRC 14428]
MRNRRLAVAGVALVAALGLTACGTTTATGGNGTGAAAQQAAGKLDPAADLSAATKKLGEQSMKIDSDMAGAITMSGVADPKAGVAKITMKMDLLGKGTSIETRKVGNDLYMKFDGSMGAALGRGANGKKWMHIDAAKVAEGSNFNLSPDDPAGTKMLLSAITGVERVGDKGFKGTLDLTKSPRFNKNKGLQALGDKATAVPFTAAKDDEGRLVELTLDMSSLGAGAGKIATTYSDFGTPVSVQAPPASEVQEMPSQFSGLVNA